MKKIKKSAPIPPGKAPSTEDLLKLIDVQLKVAPPKSNPKPKRTITKVDLPIEHWQWKDFIKYYVLMHRKYYEREDLVYSQFNAQKAFREKNRVNWFLETFFQGNRQEMKDYIQWAFKWSLTDECFIKGTLGFWNIFSDKDYVVRAYFDQGAPVKKVKKVKKRKDNDNLGASKQSWDEYFEE